MRGRGRWGGRGCDGDAGEGVVGLRVWVGLFGGCGGMVGGRIGRWVGRLGGAPEPAHCLGGFGFEDGFWRWF